MLSDNLTRINQVGRIFHIIENIQLIFLIFHTFVCKFGWVDKRLDAVHGKKIYRQMYWNFKKN